SRTPTPPHARTRGSARGGGGLSWPDQSIDGRAGRSCRNARADHRADCPGGTHGARGTGLPAEVDRFRLRSQSRHNAREIPSSPRSRCCFLDASSGGSRVEDLLSAAIRMCQGGLMKLPRRRFLDLVAGAAALPAVSRIAKAQAYPTRPVRILVGAPPGGAFDILARLIGQWLSERLRQPF